MYKRQAHYLAEAGLAKAQQILCFNVDAPLLVGEQALGNGTFSLQRRPGRQIAVSYTHLDVYKRQIWSMLKWTAQQ